MYFLQNWLAKVDVFLSNATSNEKKFILFERGGIGNR
jgi:hypothetical protein